MSDETTVTHKEYKDRLFHFLFGQEEHKDWTLSLYNAMNDSNYTDPDEIEFNTIKDALYLGMRNDVSFLISDEVNLYEHQSSYNPNMPLRQMQYISNIYEAYLTKHKLNKYGHTLIPLPIPRLVVFYNGLKEMPDEVILPLSDSFPEDGRERADIEVRVHMVNINYGQNQALLEKCKPLLEYSWLVNTTRMFKEQKVEDPFDAAIQQLPKDFVTREHILIHREEVKKMLLTEYNEEEVHELFRIEGERIGEARGKEQNTLAMIRNIMDSMQLSVEDAMNALKIPTEEQEKFKNML